MVFVWDYGAIEPEPEVIRQDIGFIADYFLKWSYTAVSSWSFMSNAVRETHWG